MRTAEEILSDVRCYKNDSGNVYDEEGLKNAINIARKEAIE